jgi:TatD DNase family protein
MLIDHHCHLDFPDFAPERDAVVERARIAGVRQLVTISTRVAQYDVYRGLAESYPGVYFSVGTHPHGAHTELDVTAERLTELTRHPKCVAVGEAGLDYFYDKSPRDAQRRGFLTHIAAARLSGLPLVIHARDADDDIGDILEVEYAKGAFSFVLHCFTGGQRLADRAVALGGYVSMSGIITFKASDGLRSVATRVPLDRLLVETDAPFLAPGPKRGKRNEPAFVTHTAQTLADVRGVSYEEICRITTENTLRLYRKIRHEAG